tara:strand:- start:200 stop:580 length:381 start_codon:yes stop_codon:yes gene_type:complete
MIKIRKIWDIIPIPIIITDLLPKKFGGGTLICIVLLRPKHKDNEGLIQHELTHVKQNLRTLLLSGFKQNWSKQHRLDRECEAYAVQLKYSPSRKDLYIDFMYNKYNLGMSKERIEKNFNKWIRRIG